MKKIIIALLICLAALLIVREIRLRQLYTEYLIVSKRSDAIVDSIKFDIAVGKLTREQSKALEMRAKEIVRKLDTLHNKFDFWNLKW